MNCVMTRKLFDWKKERKDKNECKMIKGMFSLNKKSTLNIYFL